MFKDLLDQSDSEEGPSYILDLESHFVPQNDFSANYLFMIEGQKKPIVIEVSGDSLNCYYGQQEAIDIYAKKTASVMERIISGQMTFQRAFMTGEMTAKGNFKTLRMLDHIFIFE